MLYTIEEKTCYMYVETNINPILFEHGFEVLPHVRIKGTSIGKR